jgi:hypothetical protein
MGAWLAQCRYVLGAVFLQLCQLLRLEQHPVMQKPVDPSLFIHRFADRRFSSLHLPQVVMSL